MRTKTVQVTPLSDLASEREVHDFFSFFGEIERIEITDESGGLQTAFVTFKDAKALEIALLSSGATIVDRMVTITPAENYVPNPELQGQIPSELRKARQLGCVTFNGGSVDAAQAKDWIDQVVEIMGDMGLSIDNKLRVATQLLEGDAASWWRNVQARAIGILSWIDFVREFHDQYYSQFHQHKKCQRQVPTKHRVASMPQKLSRMLKDARLLGCVTFAGEFGDVIQSAIQAKDWINQVVRAMEDMELSDDDKLKVATYLLERNADTWWSSTQKCSTAILSWVDFVREFHDQYFSQFHREEIRLEFYLLRQDNRTVTEYVEELRKLFYHVPEFLKSEEILCRRFEDGLTIAIRELMGATTYKDHRKLVQMALGAESLVHLQKTTTFRGGPPSFPPRKKPRSYGGLV